MALHPNSFDELLQNTYEQQMRSFYLAPLHFSYHQESMCKLFTHTCLKDSQNYYFLHTGLHKRIYFEILGIDSTLYSSIFYTYLQPSIERMLDQYNFHGTSYIILDGSMQIGVIFQPARGCKLSPLALAEKIDHLLEELYILHLPLPLGLYCNTTALSRCLNGYSGVYEGYNQTSRLKCFSFFYMQPGVLTDKRLSELSNNADYHYIMKQCRMLCTAFSHGRETECLAICRKLFLYDLKYSFDFTIVTDVLSYLKYAFSIRLAIYEIHDFDLMTLCSPDSYITIEECHKALEPLLCTLCHASKTLGIYSDAVVSTAFYIQNHLDENIMLSDLAAYSDLTSNRLSNQFREETKMTIKQYLANARIRHARYLLCTTDSRISDIASQCGFVDRRYFTTVFKSQTGMTPQEYRQQNIQP